MKRKATAIWRGGIKQGYGILSTDSGILLDTPYSFGTRFEAENGTNPEELIAAAYAGCFSMAFSNELSKAGLPASEITTTAWVNVESKNESWRIRDIDLRVDAQIPTINISGLERAAHLAKKNCLVGKILKVPVHLTLNSSPLGELSPNPKL